MPVYRPVAAVTVQQAEIQTASAKPFCLHTNGQHIKANVDQKASLNFLLTLANSKETSAAFGNFIDHNVSCKKCTKLHCSAQSCLFTTLPMHAKVPDTVCALSQMLNSQV